jgi:hypothetical protein
MPMTNRIALRKMAGSLLIGPPTGFFVFFALGFIDPSLIVENWDLYGLLFGLPWAAALVLLVFQKNMAE